MRKLFGFAALTLLLSAFCALFPACAAQTGGNGGGQTASETPQGGEGEENVADKIVIEVNGAEFTATLAETDAARAFAQMLPMTLSMRELNGNEKYCYLDETLPTDAVLPEQISCGDLMLFGDSCIVLFYEDFTTSYRYTPIGAADEPEGFAAALSVGDVTVTFRIG